MHKTLAIAAATGLAALSANAHAAASQASFAYTQSGSSAVLFLNGGQSVTASSRGWVTEGGNNNAGGANGNYIAGICGSSDSCFGDNLNRHNYFTFDLSNVTGVTSAVLQLTQPSNGFISSQPSHTYTLWDTLVDAGLIGSDNTIALFNDLASGTSFGSIVVNPASNGSTVSIAFNAAGLAALNKAVGHNFAFGGALNIAGGVPEPATWAMMLAGFGAIGFAMRRKPKQAARVRFAF